MDRLQATQSWDNKKISRRLDFLLKRASASDSSRVSQAHAFTQAAELALAVGDFGKGWSVLQEAFTRYETLETTERLPTPAALLGAIVGQATVTIAPNALKIKCPNWKEEQEFPWTAPTHLLRNGIGALLAAAVATHHHISEAVPALLMEMPSTSNITYGGGAEAAHIEQQREAIWMQRRLLSVAATSPEAGILSAFGLVRNQEFGILPGNSFAFFEGPPAAPESWTPALSIREDRYTAQIQLVMQDWSLEVKPWLPLIDWGLLCWEIAMSPLHEVPAMDTSVYFIRDLATEITKSRPGPRPIRTGSHERRMRAG